MIKTFFSFYGITYLRLDIAETFHQTDKALDTLKEWRDIEGHKIFASKLRFQIRLDDFRWDNRNII